MKVINTGNDFYIYDDNMKTYDAFPPQVYKIRFSQQRGFYCEKFHDIEINEKIYGVSEKKAEKSIETFERSQKNIGVILSGPKGIGKSITAKIIVNQAITKEYPVFVVDTYIPGIASYIDSIAQECVILFDEFDKTFNSRDEDLQAEMLTLFDGINIGIKKMFVITCNELGQLNEFLVNRPGRFHYHFRFDYPSDEEIRLYLEEKLDEKFWDEIDEVIKFANKVCLNYDCLRAIAFELNGGYKFKDAIKDLNIVNTEAVDYMATVTFSDGTYAQQLLTLDMQSSYEEDIYVRHSVNCEARITFISNRCKYDVVNGCYNVELESSDIRIYNPSNRDKDPDISVTSVILKVQRDNSIHFTV